MGLWLQGLPLRYQLVLRVRTEQRLHQLLAVLRGDGGVVEFLHLRQGLEHLVALVGQLGHRVVEQPEHLQFLELHELLDFGEVADQILAQVDLGQVGALLEVLEGADAVDREREHLQIGQFPQDSQVLHFIAPEV